MVKEAGKMANDSRKDANLRSANTRNPDKRN